MTTTELLSTLQARGIVVVAAGDRLRFRPVAAVTPDLRAELAARKAELLHLLATTELSRRVQAFRAGLAGGATAEDVRLPGVPQVPDLCERCGEQPLSQLYAGRCDLCAHALWIATGEELADMRRRPTDTEGQGSLFVEVLATFPGSTVVSDTRDADRLLAEARRIFPGASGDELMGAVCGAVARAISSYIVAGDAAREARARACWAELEERQAALVAAGMEVA